MTLWGRTEQFVAESRCGACVFGAFASPEHDFCIPYDLDSAPAMATAVVVVAVACCCCVEVLRDVSTGSRELPPKFIIDFHIFIFFHVGKSKSILLLV